MSITLRVKATGQVFEATTDMDGKELVCNANESIAKTLYGGLLFESFEVTRSTGNLRLKGYKRWATFRAEELEALSPS